MLLQGKVNMIRLLLIVVVYGFVVACVTGGDHSSGEARELEDKAIALHNATAKPEDQIICTREAITGTSMKRRICRTAWQIEQQLKNSRDAIEIINQQRSRKGY